MDDGYSEDLNQILQNSPSNEADVVSFPEQTITADIDTMELSSPESPFTLSLRRNMFNDDKELDKFIKSIERQIRGSQEYKDWTSYIKETLGFHACKLTGEVASQVTIDIHHHPVSLYKLTKAVIYSYLKSTSEFCSFDVAMDVIKLHFENRVGYLPVIRSLHEKIHNGFLNVPMELVHGDWRHTVFQYDYDEEDLVTIQSRMSINFENCGWNAGNYWADSSQSSDEVSL